ncbi:MAG: hypothetical protein WKF78_11690 [Candidatus Limnocylindrales bacterium]
MAEVAPVLAEPIQCDHVLDQALEPLGLGGDVEEDRATGRLVDGGTISGEDLGAAVDGRHGRAQLVGQDPDERLAQGFSLASLGDVAQDHDRLATTR